MKEGESCKAQLLIGYASAFGAMISADASFCSVQALRGAIPDFQLAVARAVVQCVLYVIGGKLVGAEFNIKKETIPGLLYLAAAYMAVNVGYFGAATYLPLSQVAGIGAIAMIVTALLHSRLSFNKDITMGNIISASLCVVGITLAIQPSWLFKKMIHDCNFTSLSLKNVSGTSHPLTSSGCSEDFVTKSTESIGYVMAIFGGVGSGVIFHICGTILTGVKPIVQSVYAASVCVIASVLFMLYMEEPVLKISISQFMLVSGHAVASSTASFLNIQSAYCLPGSTLSVVYSFEIVTMLICQYTIMHSVMPGNYNWIEVVGCLIITFGAIIPAILDILTHQAKADELP